MPGDELRLKHRNVSNRGPWEGLGNIIRFDQTEEVCLELRDSVSGCLSWKRGLLVKGLLLNFPPL